GSDDRAPSPAATMTACPSVSFDPIADRYDATRGGAARGRVIAHVLRPWIPAGGPTLEIGGGTAVVASAVADRDAVIGLDVSAATAGFGPAHVEPIPPMGRPTTPAETANLIEQRTWSWLWTIPPDAWEAEVVP